MFGYIKPCKPALEEEEFNRFRAVYCGLCLQLGKSFGMLARLTLNYDFVFLAMLHYSQTQASPARYQGRCCVNPLNQVPYCKSDASMVYSADVAAIMVHYNIQDNMQDSGLFGRLGWSVLSLFTRKAFRKASAREPFASQTLGEMMEQQRALEQTCSGSVDAASEPTAQALQALAGRLTTDPTRKEALARLGYLVGRYIYLCDAADDLEKDIKKGQYNPFIHRFLLKKGDTEGIEKAKAYALDVLQFTVSELAGVAEELEFREFSSVLENIVTVGMLGGIRQILTKKRGTRHE